MYRAWRIFVGLCWLVGFLLALPLIAVFVPFAMIWLAFQETEDYHVSLNNVYGRGLNK